MSQIFIAKTPDELQEATQYVLSMLPLYPVACFYAEMGSGKTTFIKKICEQLQVVSDTSSPTFSLVNEYQTAAGETIYHLDLYRLETLREALDAGVLQYLDSGSICFIEWPELIKPIVPAKHLEININLVEQNARRIAVDLRD